jgi:hypothetical protein
VIVALALYLVITVAALWLPRTTALPRWLASSTVVTAVAMMILVQSQVNGALSGGYSTWYVAAVGTLMTITAVRGHPVAGLLGVSLLAAHTLWWSELGALVSTGVIGSFVWVVAAILLTQNLAAARQETRAFALAEREAAQWQAGQEAHLFERQTRLRQTVHLATPMLRLIEERGGLLSSDEQRECRILEAAVRDEIRGRRLLNNAVREQIRAARERGAQVTVHDEGGIDGLHGLALTQVLDQLAAALAATAADTLIVRTVHGTENAVTVVGLSRGDASASALGLDTAEEVVVLWLEIPRVKKDLALPPQ